jgi:hypothetical protein
MTNTSKSRDIAFWVAGAAIAVIASLLVQSLAFPREAHAQTTSNQSPIQMTVTSAPIAGTAAYAPSTSGVIAINDPVGRKVTVASYNFSYGVATPGSGPQGTGLALSTPQSFSY